MTINEKQIAHFMRTLGISREEAMQLIQDDNNDVSVDLTPEQKKTAKAMAQGDRKIETKPRNRERKPDDDKRLIIDILNSRLIDACHNFDENCIDDDVVITNPEREIEFTFRGNKYRLTLSKPRK